MEDFRYNRKWATRKSPPLTILLLNFLGLPVLLQNAMQSNEVITQLRMCASCKNQSSGNIVKDIILPEPTITIEDLSSTTNGIANTTFPNNVSNTSVETALQTREISQTFTCPEHNMPISTSKTLNSSPSMARSIHSNVGSLNQTSSPDSNLAMTLPSMSTSEVHNTSTPKIPLAESLKIVPLCNCPENNSDILSKQVGFSTIFLGLFCEC